MMQYVKNLLVDQFLANANDESWYLPFTKTVENMSEEEAFWRPMEGSHSIAEIVQHLIYWNEVWQERYQHSDVKAVPALENNEKSFLVPENILFNELKERLIAILVRWQDLLMEEQLIQKVKGFPVQAKWFDILGNAITHNAYHIGQIVYIRKMQKS